MLSKYIMVTLKVDIRWQGCVGLRLIKQCPQSSCLSYEHYAVIVPFTNLSIYTVGIDNISVKYSVSVQVFR